MANNRDFIIDRAVVLALMKHDGLNQVRLARRIGCSPVSMCKWLDDSHAITYQTARKIADALGVKIRTIIKREVY